MIGGRRSARLGNAGELNKEHTRGVKAGPSAVDGNAVGGEVRVIGDGEVGTVAVDGLLSDRPRGLDGAFRSPAEGRRRGGLIVHLGSDDGLIEDRREKARATLPRVRFAG